MPNPPDEYRRAAIARAAQLTGLLLMPPLLMSCGGGAAAIVPFITFVFEGVATVNAAGDRQVVQLNIDPNSTQQGKSSGTLDSATLATSDLLGNSLQRRDISGSFSGDGLSFSVAGAVAPLASAYSGRFVAADTIVLTPTSAGLPAITLLRVDNSFRPTLDLSTWTGRNASGEPWTMSLRAQEVGLAAELLTGTDNLAGQAGTLAGFAEMRDLEITITRGASVTRLSGALGPAGTTPPGPNLATAQTMAFADGSSLTRDP